jgi:hypothetical protein
MGPVLDSLTFSILRVRPDFSFMAESSRRIMNSQEIKRSPRRGHRHRVPIDIAFAEKYNCNGAAMNDVFQKLLKPEGVDRGRSGGLGTTDAGVRTSGPAAGIPALCALVLALAVALPVARAAAQELPDKSLPQMSEKEKAMLQGLAGDKKKIESFLATRLYMRRLAAFIAELPAGVKYDILEHGYPQPPESLDIEYTLTFDEQLHLYKILLDGSPGRFRSHPLVRTPATTAAPPDRAALLARLPPPVSAEEEKLLDKALRFPASEVPKFFETRKYVRLIREMEAKLPAGRKLDPGSAPEPSKMVDIAYMTREESSKYGDFIMAWLEKLNASRPDK